jgi:ADP-ribose pyrophosphatase YjhB (NUDIX family)
MKTKSNTYHERYYKNKDRHLVAVDSIIFGFDKKRLKILLIKRNFEPCRGEWSLMGGFLKKDESLDEAATRVLYTLTGLKEVYLEQLYTYGDINRDPGARVISTVYYALINIEQYKEQLNQKYSARWWDINSYPNLIFDHNNMVNNALGRLQRTTRTQPIGFELLPEKFTIPQLRALYEAIHQKKMDKRNFRKKILSYGFLERLDEKDKSTSKKGAYLYKFNEEKYKKQEQNGYIFEI